MVSLRWATRSRARGPGRVDGEGSHRSPSTRSTASSATQQAAVHTCTATLTFPSEEVRVCWVVFTCSWRYQPAQAAEQGVSQLEHALGRMADAMKFLCNDFPLVDDITPQALLYQVCHVLAVVPCRTHPCLQELGAGVGEASLPHPAARQMLFRARQSGDTVQRVLMPRPEFGYDVGLPAAWDEAVRVGACL